MVNYLKPYVLLSIASLITLKIKGQNLPYEPPTPISCSPTQNCPEEFPCCSQFWTCGTGPICVIGCNPKNSFTQNSCLKGPAFLPPKFAKKRKIRKLKKQKSSKEKGKVSKRFEISYEALDDGFDLDEENVFQEDIDNKNINNNKRDNDKDDDDDEVDGYNEESDDDEEEDNDADEKIVDVDEYNDFENDDDDSFEDNGEEDDDDEPIEADIFVIAGEKSEQTDLESAILFNHLENNNNHKIILKRSQGEQSFSIEALVEETEPINIINQYDYSFGSNSISIQHEDIDRKGPLVANSYAGDYINIPGTSIIPWTDFLITADLDKAKDQWDNVDFTYSGVLKMFENDEKENSPYIYLAMPKKSAGSLLTTTRSMLYGRIGVHLKAGRGNGVITTIVLFSNVHDEIDFEFLGGDLMNAQTNYYHQGELIHTRMIKAHTETSIRDNWHYYEIDWNPDRIHWYIDGRIVRTLQKVDTWDAQQKIYKYPQTPMKLHVSIWPGGSESNSPGTIDWAGGLVDWENAQDIKEKGEFDCKVKSINVNPLVNKQMQEFKKKYTKNSKIHPNRRFAYSYDPENQLHDYMFDNVVLKNDDIVYLSGFGSNGEHPNM
ncbi:hypothetical protein ACO0SA_003221 [Hanseniaspora valbyensis]